MKNGSVFKWIVGLVFVLPVIALCVFVFVERQYFFGTTGIVSSGEKYGVEIGSPVGTAKQILERENFEESPYYSSSNDLGCLGFAETREFKKVVFVDNSWRRGTVCIASQEGVVEYVAWRYSFFDP